MVKSAQTFAFGYTILYLASEKEGHLFYIPHYPLSGEGEERVDKLSDVGVSKYSGS